MSEPTTEAELLRPIYTLSGKDHVPTVCCQWHEAVIEAEAVAAERERIIRGVEQAAHGTRPEFRWVWSGTVYSIIMRTEE